MPVGHARVGPPAGKALELIKLVRNKSTVATISGFDDMLEARRASSTLTCQDGAGRTVKRVRERHRTLRVRVLKAGLLVNALLVLGALEILPLGQLVRLDIELLWHLGLGNKHVAQELARAVIALDNLARGDMPVLHDARVHKRGNLAPFVEVTRSNVGVIGDVNVPDSRGINLGNRERL